MPSFPSSSRLESQQKTPWHARGWGGGWGCAALHCAYSRDAHRGSHSLGVQCLDDVRVLFGGRAALELERGRQLAACDRKKKKTVLVQNALLAESKDRASAPGETEVSRKESGEDRGEDNLWMILVHRHSSVDVEICKNLLGTNQLVCWLGWRESRLSKHLDLLTRQKRSKRWRPGLKKLTKRSKHEQRMTTGYMSVSPSTEKSVGRSAHLATLCALDVVRALHAFMALLMYSVH